ncbi:hypothetical protein EJD97_024533 [Solanum chilense]|uniref:Reverse transcriptase domain-containing protein n=1 Tax=Solanum chilense TaxID=4083 RepID=A0A6N2C1D0_SOLCI|nr:hypothetical protein EJD97_024533 [Solanum chilense]
MPNTLRGREPLFPYDHELERTLRNMNRNFGINDDDPNKNIPAPVYVHGQLLPADPGENQQRGQNPAPRPQEYYRGYDNIEDADGPLVLPHLPVGHTVVVTRESVSSSWNRFTSFLESVPNHRIDDESLKEYFYRGHDDNNKPVLDTIAGGSYGEFPYAEIAQKLENISWNNKAWSTRKSDIGRNTFAVQSTNNPATDKIPEEMAQMITEFGLAQTRRIGAKAKYTKVGSMVTITVRFIMSKMKTTTATTTSIGVTMVIEMIEMGPMFLLNCEVTQWDGGDSMAGVEDMLHKMIRRFDASDEHMKELSTDLEVRSLQFVKALCDLGASIDLMPLMIYKKWGLGDPKPTATWLLMADRIVKRPIGILHDVLVKVESFIFPGDFIILYCEVNFEEPIILGSPFLATR